LSVRSFPLAVIETIDMAGSAAMILLSLLAVSQAMALRRKDPQNVMWTYLVWFCSGLLVFAFSRSLGHIAKHLLIAADLGRVWSLLKPVSGSLNTITFVIAGAITLFFSRVYHIYQRMLLDKATIEKAHREIAELNIDLEKKVLARTRELSASEEKYRRVFEKSKDMLFICDLEGTILDMNPSGLEILDLKGPDDLLRRNFFKDFFGDGKKAEAVQKELQEKGFIKDAELILQTPKGNKHTVLFSGTMTQTEESRLIGLEGIIKDITLRKEMEAQLMQADKLASLGQLSAGLAHEINNPLGLVLGYTRLVMKETDPEVSSYGDLKVIEKHALNCKNIVENLLKFSRAAGTIKSAVNLNHLIREVINVVKHKFSMEKVQIHDQLSSDLPLTMADPEKISQVFMNILMNAFQSIESAGVISVSSLWDPERRRFQIIFEDTGSGIPPEILPKIFDPFFTTKPIGMGTGLGLAVSYGIIKDHSGRIRVESTPRKGSRFIVELPLIESAETEAG